MKRLWVSRLDILLRHLPNNVETNTIKYNELEGLKKYETFKYNGKELSL